MSIQEQPQNKNHIELSRGVLGYDSQADIQGLQFKSEIRTWESKMLRIHNEAENVKLIDLKFRKQKTADFKNQKSEEVRKYRCGEAERQRQEVELKRKLQARSYVDYQERVIKEKGLLKEKKVQQEKKERQMLFGLDEKYAQERIHQAVKKESKKRNLKHLLDDISTQKLNREKEIQLDRIEEQKAQLQLEKKCLQRQTGLPESVRNRQVRQQIVCDQLAALKKEQALGKEQRYFCGVAKREAKGAKREKRDVKLPPISAHTENMTENEMKKRAERQSHVDHRQADKEPHRLFLDGSKRKTREEMIRLNLSNASLAAEKKAHPQQQEKEECAAAMRIAEQNAAREKFLQQLQREHRKAAVELSHRRQVDLEEQLRYKKKRCPPPISKAAEESF